MVENEITVTDKEDRDIEKITQLPYTILQKESRSIRKRMNYQNLIVPKETRVNVGEILQ